MSVKVNLDRWLPHLEAARREGMTLNAYARGRGLAACTLYAARQMLSGVRGGRMRERSGLAQRLPSKAVAETAFAAVKLTAPVVPLSGSTPRLQARLPNGVMLELSGADAALLAVAIKTLAGR